MIWKWVKSRKLYNCRDCIFMRAFPRQLLKIPFKGYFKWAMLYNNIGILLRFDNHKHSLFFSIFANFVKKIPNRGYSHFLGAFLSQIYGRFRCGGLRSISTCSLQNKISIFWGIFELNGYKFYWSLAYHQLFYKKNRIFGTFIEFLWVLPIFFKIYM